MTVYADVLVAMNFLIDWFLLKASSLLTGSQTSGLRLTLGGLAGGVSSLLILLPEQSLAVSLLIRVVLAAGMVFITFGRQKLLTFCKLFLAYFAASLVVAGGVTAVWFLAAPAGLVIRNGTFYYPVSPLLLLGVTMLSYLFLRLGKKWFRRSYVSRLYYSVKVENCMIRAKLDSGMTLSDPYNRRPVMLIEPETAHRLSFIVQGTPLLLPYETVKGTGCMQAFAGGPVVVQSEAGTKKLESVMFAVSPRPFHGDFNALVGCDWAERTEFHEKVTNTADSDAEPIATPLPGGLHKRTGYAAAPAETGTGGGVD